MDSLKGIVKAYERWVAANPETVSDLETTSKWVSYFIAGRISDSNVVSELVFSLSNLLVLYNDRIIDTAGSKSKYNTMEFASAEQSNSTCYRLKVMLTTLEYCEVLIEISAKRIFGNKGKWLLVVLLQGLKAAGRFFILKHSTTSIITTPTIPALNRRVWIKQQKEGVVQGQNESAAPAEATTHSSFTFQLKRSGRVVRKVEGAPPLAYRDFKLHADLHEQSRSSAVIPSALLQAEYLYIAKPLIHLAAMGVFGEKRWKQYVVALALDVASIRLYHKHRHLMNKQQKLELSRRCINLLLYLMRSPFYERFTQSRLERVLGFFADNVPFMKMVASPLLEYIPHWQNTYFYLWST